MAYCDYKHCFICECKTYYDAGLNYPDDLDLKVLCGECAKEYVLVCQKRI